MIDTNHIEQRARELLAAECDRTVEGMRYDAHGVVSLNVALSAIRRALSARASAGEGDYRTHHDDFRVACLVAQAHATSDADRSYWQHQVDVLDRIKAAAPQPAQAGASGGGGYQRAWEHIAENSYDHNTPGMICIPTEEWKAAEAMFTADKGGSNG